MPRNRTARLAVLGSGASQRSQSAPVLLPLVGADPAPRRRRRARRRRAGADHGLLPRVERRRCTSVQSAGATRPEAVRGRRRPRRAAVPRRLRLLQRPRPREAETKKLEGRDRELAQRPHPDRAARARRTPALARAARTTRTPPRFPGDFNRSTRACSSRRAERLRAAGRDRRRQERRHPPLVAGRERQGLVGQVTKRRRRTPRR